MAITSTGYDGTITEAQWAKLVPLVGSSHYGVSGPSDWKVTASSSLDRGVNIAVGSGWGHGVLDTSNSVESLQGATVSSGSRWDLVVARRNWSGTGGTTTFALVTGSSLKAIPSRNTTPGTLDDQPVALVQFTAGSTSATSIVDLRCWGRNGGMVARDTLALGYLQHLGAQVKINSALWSCIPDGAGLPTWSSSATDGMVQYFGLSGSLHGGTPPSTSELLQSAGTMIGTTDNSGYVGIDFPRPFPNGLMTIVVTNGDANVDAARGRGPLTFSVAGTPWGTGTKDRVVLMVRSPAGPETNLTVRINYIALGW